jgi:predicted permease
MPILPRVRSLWRNLLHREAVERDLDDELRAAEDELARRYVARGLSQADASRAARMELGGVEPTRESVRDVRIGVHLERVVADVRFAWRTLRKAPAFTAAAVASLALGIGGNVAIFTCLNAIVLRPLPVREPSALVDVGVRRNGAGGGFISFPMYRDLVSAQQPLTGIVATAGETPSRVTVPSAHGANAEIDNVRISFVSGNYFSVLGLDPAAGRLFTPDDDANPDSASTAGSVVVLSDDFWNRQFGRDPAVVGRTILIGRTRAEVIGVTPRGFVGEVVGNAADGWVPLTNWSSRDDLDNRRGTFTSFFGRLKPGVTRAEAQARLTPLFQQFLTAEGIQQEPAEYAIALESASAGLDFALRRTYVTPLLIVMGMVALVLLIACANVANLLLGRAAARAGEIGIRLALGCSRGRLVRQLLTESALLSIAGAGLGLLVSRWAAQSLARLALHGPVGMRLDLSPDVRVVGFVAGLAILTTVVFGLVPALRSTRVDLAPALKGLRRGSGSGVRQRAGRALVVAQVATSLLLLVGAGLLVRSFQKLHAQDYGFNPDRVLIFSLGHGASDRSPEAMTAVERAARQRVLAIPGVQSASFSGIMLFSPSDIGSAFSIPGEPDPNAAPHNARYNSVSPGYFETVGMRLVAGRSFTEADDSPSAPHVTVVNESFARRFFPGGAVGRSLTLGRPGRGKNAPGGAPEGPPVEIVGIVHDAKYNNLREDAKPLFFLPFAQMTRSLRALEVRTAQPSAAIAGPVREALAGVTKDIMIRGVSTLAEQVDASLAAEQLLLRLCVVFGALALLLACVGLYGVIAYSVAQRTAEIGVRVALGATPASVMRGVLRETMVLVVAGVAIGIPAALASSSLLVSFLFGITPRDPATFAGAAAILLSSAALAAAIPAVRAARVDPIVALRYE